MKQAKRAMKKDQEKNEEENLTNQLGIQIDQLKSQVTGVNKTLSFLDEEFAEWVFSAENKLPTEQLQLIAKTTALKRNSNYKKQKITKLKEQIKVLEMKKKKVQIVLILKEIENKQKSWNF